MWAFWRFWQQTGSATLAVPRTVTTSAVKKPAGEVKQPARAVPRATLRDPRTDRSRVAVILSPRQAPVFDKPVGRRR